MASNANDFTLPSPPPAPDARKAARIASAQAAFKARFGNDPQAVGVAPGRVELLGNHTDYNQGFVLTAAIDRGIAFAGSAREVPRARIGSGDRNPMVTFDPSKPDHDPQAQGVVDELNKAGATVGGFDGAIVSDVPVGAGVSSSAALLVSTAELLLTLYPHQLLVDAMGVAKLCQKAENNFVGAPVGILDQFSSVFGVAGHALFLDCRTLEHKTVKLSPSDAHILIADSGVKHQLAAGGGYRERRAQCEEAARWFAQKTGQKITALRDVTPQMLEQHAIEMDETLEKRARHIVYEDMRVRLGAEALEAGNLDAFGEMMNNTHESCRRFFENSCEEIDALVEIAQNQAGVYGAKLTGGGWGGCAVIIHRPDALDSLSDALKTGYKTRFGREVGLLPTLAAQGAEAVRLD